MDPRYATKRVRFDKRTRAYKAWSKRCAELLEELGRVPRPSELSLIESLADCEIMIEAARRLTQRGEPIEAQLFQSLVSEARRSKMALGLLRREGDPPRAEHDLAGLLEGAA